MESTVIPYMKPLVIYHGECADGFAGAWTAHRAFSGNLTLHAAMHGSAPPDVEGKDVYMLDFAYPRSTMITLAKKANKLVLLDHHKTALQELKDLKQLNAVLDMTRSGSHITWDYFFPRETAPALMLYIEDQDLGRFELPFSREVNEAVFSYPYSLAVWERLMMQDISVLMQEGTILLRKLNQDLSRLIPALTRKLRIAGYEVPAVNLPFTLAPHAAEALAKGVPFAVGYWDTPEVRVFSMRSEPEGLDVAEIAKVYGGGGHARSAGFRVSRETAALFDVLKD